jgi:hypothetical protein
LPTISTLTVDVETNTSGFSKGLKVAAGGLAVLAGGAVYAFSQFEDSEKVMRQTDAVLKSTGSSAKVTADHITSLAGALSDKSAIDDEVIQSGENMLLTFKNVRNETGQGNRIFDRATVAMTDMAAGMAAASGGAVDLKGSSIILGKALNDPVAGLSALSRVGVTFTQQQKDQITAMTESGDVMGAQKIILKELSSEFKGSAEANATSTEKTKVALGNLAETVGGLLAPAFEFLATALQGAISFLQDNAGPVFQAIGGWFQNIWDKVQPLVQIVGGALVDAWNAAVEAVQKIMPDLKRLWESLQPILKIVGLVVGVLIVLAAKALPIVVTAVGIAIDIFVKIETALANFLNAVGRVILGVIDWFQKLPDKVRAVFDRVNDWLGGWPAKILGFFGDAARLLWDIGKAIIQGLWDGMKAVWNSLTGWIGSIGGWIKNLKGPMSKDKDLLTDQGEAIIKGLGTGMDKGWRGVRGKLGGFNAELAMGGVAGPGAGGAGAVTINVAGSLYGMSKDELANLVHDLLLQKQRRTGDLGLGA